MRVEHYIAELLYRYHCVVMPEFGGFLTNNKSAVIDSVSNSIYPPTKILSFNEQLSKNDGLLVAHMAKANKMTYEEMLKEVVLVSKDWKKRLNNGDVMELFGIGSLRINGNGKIAFQPENKINYLSSSFGLASFGVTPVKREVLKEAVEQLEEEVPFIITPEKRASSSFRPWLKYAALVLLAVSTGIVGYQLYNNNKNQLLVRQEAQEQVSKYIQEATFFESDPLELPSLNLNITKIETIRGKHHVIAGAFRVRSNADKKIETLQNKGYQSFYLGTNRYGLYQVAYASFENPKEALTFLRQIRRTESRDAWLLSEK